MFSSEHEKCFMTTTILDRVIHYKGNMTLGNTYSFPLIIKLKVGINWRIWHIFMSG